MKWINCSERLPQQSDADWAGNVVTQTDQRYQIVQWDKVDKELDDYWLMDACDDESKDADNRN